VDDGVVGVVAVAAPALRRGRCRVGADRAPAWRRGRSSRRPPPHARTDPDHRQRRDPGDERRAAASRSQLGGRRDPDLRRPRVAAAGREDRRLDQARRPRLAALRHRLRIRAADRLHRRRPLGRVDRQGGGRQQRSRHFVDLTGQQPLHHPPLVVVFAPQRRQVLGDLIGLRHPPARRDRRAHGLGRRGPPRRIDRHRRRDRRVERLGHLGPQRPHRRGTGRRQDRRQDLRLALPAERALARQQPVADHAEGEDIHARVGRLAAQVLRRHVAVLALEHPRRGALAGDRRRRLGDPEVDDLRHPVEGQQQVVERHVPVDQPQRRVVDVLEGVRVAKPARGVDQDPAGHLGRHRPRPRHRATEDARQREPVDVLHRDEVAAFVLAELEHLDAVRVAEQRRDPRLAEEHRRHRRGAVVAGDRADRLEHDDLGEAGRPRRTRQPDVAHPARREAPEHLVAGDPRPRQRRRCHG
jgi:hypothetical protein